MKIDVLRNFLAVAETENLTRASERLNLVQSALSHQIKCLEDDVGAELFVRNGRRLRLSDAGKGFAADVRSALAMIAAAKVRARQVADGSVGEIHVGFETISSRNRHVSESLLTFRDSHPRVHMELTHLPAGPLVDAILHGDVDAGFVHLSGPSAELETILFQRTDWVLAVPRTHRLAEASSIRLADLAGESFIWRARHISPAVYDRMIAACRAGGLQPNIIQEANNDVMMMNLVSVGFGLCFVVDSLYSYAPDDPVVFRKVDDLSMPLDLCLAWRRDNLSRPLPHLIDIVRRQLGSSETGN